MTFLSIKNCFNQPILFDRELCGLKSVKTFDGFTDLIPKPIVQRLKLIYKDVEDVDLFIGGISESSLPGKKLFKFAHHKYVFVGMGNNDIF